MTRRPPPYEYEERRLARIRALREQREGPVRRRRRVEPILFLAWMAGAIALLGVLLVIGFLTVFAPRVMAWVEDNPGAIEHGIVRDFVEWWQPSALADEPASAERQRITVEIPQGVSDTRIGEILEDAGVISSRLAFQYQVIQAERAGTLAFGVYDLSPTLRPSEIVATLRGEAIIATTVGLQEGLRLEEMVAALGQSELTMNLEEFAALVEEPPADFLNQFDFLADLPAGRSLEGYLYPAQYEIEIAASEAQVAAKLLEEFGRRLTPEIREGIAAQGLSIDEAVIIASIVEREAVIDDERPLIAAVYINRIQNPQLETVGLLNADPTLQYGLASAEHRLGQPSVPVDGWAGVEWWPQLQVSGGEIQLPEALLGYQTYLVPGLPPTPIAAPRDSSLAAVAAARTDEGFLYFVAGCPDGVRDGSHYFSKTLSEHNANIARANQECAGQ